MIECTSVFVERLHSMQPVISKKVWHWVTQRTTNVANSTVTATEELHSRPQHSLLALALCLEKAFKHSDVLCSLENKSNSACVYSSCHSGCLCKWEFFIREDKKQKCVWALPIFSSSVNPPHQPQGSNAWPGLYTIHRDHSMGEKWSHYFHAVMGYICFVALSVL